LESQAMDAMTALGEQELALGNADAALRAARLAVAIDHLREDAHRLIIRALNAKGRRANALKHYEELISTLRRELDVGPDADTAELAVELRRSQSKTARTQTFSATTRTHRVNAKNKPNMDWHAPCRLPKWHG
jgi:DNA-binding SARP family transcriptional activator